MARCLLLPERTAAGGYAGIANPTASYGVSEADGGVLRNTSRRG